LGRRQGPWLRVPGRLSASETTRVRSTPTGTRSELPFGRSPFANYTFGKATGGCPERWCLPQSALRRDQPLGRRLFPQALPIVRHEDPRLRHVVDETGGWPAGTYEGCHEARRARGAHRRLGLHRSRRFASRRVWTAKGSCHRSSAVPEVADMTPIPSHMGGSRNRWDRDPWEPNRNRNRAAQRQRSSDDP
jgi:hypothetical protein